MTGYGDASVDSWPRCRRQQLCRLGVRVVPSIYQPKHTPNSLAVVNLTSRFHAIHSSRSMNTNAAAYFAALLLSRDVQAMVYVRHALTSP